YFDGKFKVQCGTCHRGNVRPERTPGPLFAVVATLPGGGAAPSSLFVLGPAGFQVKTRGELREAVAKDEDHRLLPQRAHDSSEVELGHVAPGSYSLCAVGLPSLDPSEDPKGSERPVSCVPVTVDASHAGATLQLLPL